MPQWQHNYRLTSHCCEWLAVDASFSDIRDTFNAVWSAVLSELHDILFPFFESYKGCGAGSGTDNSQVPVYTIFGHAAIDVLFITSNADCTVTLYIPIYWQGFLWLCVCTALKENMTAFTKYRIIYIIEKNLHLVYLWTIFLASNFFLQDNKGRKYG